MDLPLFHPGAAHDHDKISEKLSNIAHYILVAAFGLLPFLFIPSIYLPFASGKVLIASFAVAAALLFLVMSILRRGVLTIRYPLVLIGVWAIAAATLVAALLSGDMHDSLLGDGLDSYSAFFALLMALTVTLTVSLRHNRQAITRLYGVLVFSAVAISLFHLIRFVLGPEALSFGLFTGATDSPVGSWNGLAIFYGLVVLLALLALYQLPFSQMGRYIAIGVIALALLMLAVINFNPAWWVLAIVSGVLFIHKFAVHLWKRSPQSSSRAAESLEVILATVGILAIAVVFLIGGARIGSIISQPLGVSYLEVRPSLMATTNITKAVYADDLFFGAGPNRFADVWRLHKDPAINQTIFWSTPFDSAYSYVTTVFIGTGVLGVIAYLIFFAGLLWSGCRFIMSAPTNDRFWHFIGFSSLVASVYLWIMSVVYVPPPSMLLLTALTTGVFIASYVHLVPGRSFTLSAVNSRFFGIALVAALVVVLSGVGYVNYVAANDMLAVYRFNHALGSAAAGDSINDIDDRIVAAFDISRNDAFAARIAYDQLSQMRAILNVQEPSATDQQTFQAAASRAIEAAQTAINLDPTNPYNRQIIGQIYAVLALVGVEGASDRAREAFASAAAYDPQNPFLDLLDADLSLGAKDLPGARARAEDAVRKKPNYTEALFFLAQLDISEGNVDRAIIIVNGIAQLEPQNPARRYQLGVLLASAGRLDEAVAAFEQAVALDPQYANARYFLALGYAEQGKVDAAIEQLTVVRSLNESNAAVDALIGQLKSNGRLSESLTTGTVVPERDADSGNVTEDDLDNDLVTSANPAPSASSTASSTLGQ